MSYNTTTLDIIALSLLLLAVVFAIIIRYKKANQKNNYYYFVSYYYETKDGTTRVDCEMITTSVLIDDDEKAIELGAYIIQQKKHDYVAIINFQLLKTEKAKS